MFLRGSQSIFKILRLSLNLQSRWLIIRWMLLAPFSSRIERAPIEPFSIDTTVWKVRNYRKLKIALQRFYRCSFSTDDVANTRYSLINISSLSLFKRLLFFISLEKRPLLPVCEENKQWQLSFCSSHWTVEHSFDLCFPGNNQCGVRTSYVFCNLASPFAWRNGLRIHVMQRWR